MATLRDNQSTLIMGMTKITLGKQLPLWLSDLSFWLAVIRSAVDYKKLTLVITQTTD